MLKVLIADDEYKVGFLVKKLIDWDKLNLEFAGLVQDGMTAYEKICECAPDIVITDIRMPVLSGLELIKKVIDEGRSVHFIVISGYKYFEYAQQAIKYGVEDYLLKPIDEVELNQILKKIADTETNREKESRSVDTMVKKLHDSRYILHREFLNSISGDWEMNLEEVNKNYGLNFGDGLFRVICCKLDGDNRVEKNEQQINLILKKTGALVEQAFQGCVRDIAITYQKNSAVTAVINYTAECRDEVEQRIDRLFQSQMDYLSGFEHYELTMGLSSECGEFGRLHVAVETAREAVACRILGGAGRQIDERFIERDSTVCAEEICGELEEKLARTLSGIHGAGETEVMLTLKSGSRQVLAQDTQSRGEGERSVSTVTLGRGSGSQEVVPLQTVAPQFRGALVVCAGGDDPGVRLQVIRAVSALTGLGSDCITVCQGDP